MPGEIAAPQLVQNRDMVEVWPVGVTEGFAAPNVVVIPDVVGGAKVDAG